MIKCDYVFVVILIWDNILYMNMLVLDMNMLVLFMNMLVLRENQCFLLSVLMILN